MAYRHWKANPDIKKIVVFKNDGLQLFDDDTVTVFWDDFVRLGMNASDEIAMEVEARTGRGLPDDINEACSNADTLVLVVPSPYFKETVDNINVDISGKNIVSAVKGIVPEEDHEESYSCQGAGTCCQASS